MGDLTVTAADVSPVEVFEQFVAPAAEALNAGEVVRLDTTAGYVTPANATDTSEARAIGVAIQTATYAGEAITVVKRGILDVGDALGDMTHDDAVFLSNTDGTMGTAAATVTKVIGRVVAGFGYTTTDKLLWVDLAVNADS